MRQFSKEWKQKLRETKKEFYKKNGVGGISGRKNANYKGMPYRTINYDILGDWLHVMGLLWYDIHWLDFYNYQQYVIIRYKDHWEWQAKKGAEQLQQDAMPYFDLREDD